MDIRHAAPTDAEPISTLIEELGYTITPQALRLRFACLQDSTVDAVFVAVLGERLVGCISLHAFALFHLGGKLGRITSFVVAAGWRGQGTGSALLAAAHQWFEAAGCVKFEVTSGDQREAAHRFYRRHGYARDGQRLARPAMMRSH